jgi:uncharacterized protein (TIGR03000 family)
MLKRCFPVVGAAALVLLLTSPGSSRAQVVTYSSGWGQTSPWLGAGHFTSWPGGIGAYSVPTVSYGGYPYGNLGLGTYPGYPFGFIPTSIAVDPMTYVAFYPPLLSTRAPVAAPAPGVVAEVQPVAALVPGVVSADQPATVEVVAPADAVLIFDGHKTAQTGSRRVFTTPPLTPGESYHYTVEAAFTQGGKRVEQRQRVAVRAGDTTPVVFR